MFIIEEKIKIESQIDLLTQAVRQPSAYKLYGTFKAAIQY
jgi:hypothetical protein